MKYFCVVLLFLAVWSFTATAQTHYALSFDGTSGQYVRVPHSDTLAPTAAITVEAWVINSTSTGGPSIVSKTEVGGYAFYKATTNFRFDVRLNGSYHTVSFDGAALSGGWHHFAATCDGQYTRLYVDGDLKNTDNAGAVHPIQYAYQNSLIIGAEASASANTVGDYYTGSIDEVRIWNIARTSSEINSSMSTSLAGNESGLIGYWNFDEGTGTNANDLTQYNHDGALVNSPAWISSSALPVELISFTARAAHSRIELSWHTATETNNYGFEIERRAASDPHLQGEGHFAWRKISFVEGNGTTNAPKEYSFIDNNLAAGKYLYRLKQIDSDGKFEYSPEIEVIIGYMPDKFSLMQNYPNPFNPMTTIEFTLHVSGLTSLKIFDALGREEAVLVNETKAVGKYSIQFDASALPSGIYFAELTAASRSQTRKLLLIK